MLLSSLQKSKLQTYLSKLHAVKQGDTITWQDLHMDELFLQINRCATTAGDEALLDMLKYPELNTIKLRNLNKELEQVEAVHLTTAFLQFNDQLAKAGRNEWSIREQLEMGVAPKLISGAIWLGRGLRLLVAINLITAILLAVYQNTFALSTLILSLLVSLLSHYFIVNKWSVEIKSLTYLLSLIKVTTKLSHHSNASEYIAAKDCMTIKNLMASTDALKPHLRRTKGIFIVEGMDVFGDYLAAITQAKVLSFLKSVHLLSKNLELYQAFYRDLGRLEAMLSIVSLTKDLSLSTPHFTDGDKGGLHLRGAIHPLVKAPVANDISLEGGYLITGSNMSGKSTLLRTVAINAICAQSIGRTFCEHYIGEPVSIISCISLNDDLSKGKSYYLMEAETIKRMVLFNHQPARGLFLIDEIFKGTNPSERIAAATVILNDLVAKGALVLCTTHDHLIIPKLTQYNFGFFMEQVNVDALTFDYKLHSGVAKTRNAIKILEYLQYPKPLTDTIKEVCANEYDSTSEPSTAHQAIAT